MDRSVLEGDPYCVIEGMMIAAYAIGCTSGYVYVRAEYPLAIERLQRLWIHATRRASWGRTSGGGGLISICVSRKGRAPLSAARRPPSWPPSRGSGGCPAPGRRFRPSRGSGGNRPTSTTWRPLPTFAISFSRGPTGSPPWAPRPQGTKIFAVTGKVKHTGLVEVPMGMTVREVIFDLGGGIPNNRKFKAVQAGGPSGGCVPAEVLDTPVDYDSLIKAGAMMGSGGLVVMDETTCMVDVARFFLTSPAWNRAVSACPAGSVHGNARHPGPGSARGTGGKATSRSCSAWRGPERGFALRAGPDRAEPCPLHRPALPLRIRRAHPPEAVPSLGLRGSRGSAVPPRVSRRVNAPQYVASPRRRQGCRSGANGAASQSLCVRVREGL